MDGGEKREKLQTGADANIQQGCYVSSGSFQKKGGRRRGKIRA